MQNNDGQKHRAFSAGNPTVLEATDQRETQGFFVTREVCAGFLAPLESLRFFANHKMMMLMGLAPFVGGLICYFWAFSLWILPWVLGVMATWGWDPSGVGTVVTLGLTAVAYLAAFALFALLGMPLVNMLASPVFDLIAEKAFLSTGRTLRPDALTFRLFIRSFVNETLKTSLFLGCVVVSFFVPLLAPFAVLASLWFFGWDHIDRTLALFHLPLGRRIAFGLRHCIACICLGIWRYMPFVGSLLSFVMSAAGALVVAKISQNNELKN